MLGNKPILSQYLWEETILQGLLKDEEGQILDLGRKGFPLGRGSSGEDMHPVVLDNNI